MTRQLIVKYKPRGANNDKVRVEASVWADAPGGGLFVVPLDGGPRRILHVKLRGSVWIEDWQPKTELKRRQA